MKNKRTKLTAILLSALMAVSTISSVTWAADLFSDGSDGAEVLNEEETSEETLIFGDPSEDASSGTTGQVTGEVIRLEDVKFKYENGDDGKPSKVVAEYTIVTKADSGEEKLTGQKSEVQPYEKAVKITNTCSEPEKAVYCIEVDGFTVISNTDNTASITSYEDPYGNIFTSPSDGYIYVPGTSTKTHIKGHQVSSEPKDEVITSPTCQVEGLKFSYYYCTGCGLVIDDTNASSLTVKPKNPTETFAEYLLRLMGSPSKGSDNVYEFEDLTITEVDDNSATTLVNIKAERMPLNDHNYDEANPVILRDDYYVYGNGDIESGNVVSFKSGALIKGKPIENYKVENGDNLLKYAPINCKYNSKTGQMEIANPENNRDAYYYTMAICTNCYNRGEETIYVKILDKVNLKDAPGEIEGDRYEEVEGGNILGFLSTSGTSFDKTKYKFAYGIDGYAYYLPISDRIWADDYRLIKPLVPVLEDCNKNGYYYIRTYEKDTPEAVNTVKVEVDRLKQSHTWGTIEVLPSKKKINEVSSTITEDNNLLTTTLENRGDIQFASDVSNGFIVVRDSNNNVIEAKSKDCITEAKYELYHQCIICGKVEKLETKTASYNTDRHHWSDWSDKTDDADNKYYKIDDETHKKFTYYHRTCDLCGLRGLKLANEFVEGHKFFETRYDDDFDGDGVDSTLVEPNCGVDGHYDVILRCACRYEDESSRKQTIIPATDKHDFGDNPAEIQIVGEIQVGGREWPSEPQTETVSHIVYAQIVRKCNICGKYDSNGINNTQPGSSGDVISKDMSHIGPTVIIDTPVEGRTFTDYKAPKKDQKTGVAYPCSTGWITVNFNWAGKVDGKTKKLSDSKTVPYYANEETFAGSRAHQADDVRIEGKVDATTEAPGHYDRVVYCSVCGDEVSRETIEIAQIGSAPSIKAVSANYNTINVSWDAVEGADHYRLYYKSSDVGVTTWKLVRTVNGTSFTHSGLVTGAKYRYTVRAVLNGVNGEYDRKGSVAIPKLAAPENVAVTAVSGKNKVSWSKVDGANGYIIQRSTGSGWTRVGSVKKGAKVTWTDKKPVSGATYRVRAYRTVNDANFSKNNVYSAFSAAK